MRGHGFFPPLVRKEVRSQLPLWGACIAALAAAWLMPTRLLHQAAVVAYIIGPLAIGAHTVGQEHAQRTLPALLSQPIDRRRLYRVKLGVAVCMVTAIALAASRVLRPEIRTPGIWYHVTVQSLPALGGICVAPWLAMITRSTIAGMLFPASAAALTFLGSTLAVAWWSDTSASAAQAAVTGPWSLAMIAFCGVAAWLGARRFARLEAIDEPPAAMNLPRWIRGADGIRMQRPIAALVAKEIHLQQLTFVLAAVFLLSCVALGILRRSVPSLSSAPAEAAPLLYCACLSILIGALASAEERQHGTLDCQLLQPTPAWQQWLVKVAVSFALALVFAAALPMVMLRLIANQNVGFWQVLAIGVVLLTAGALYVSSLASSGVRAMVLSLPLGVLTALFIQAAARIARFLIGASAFSTARNAQPTTVAYGLAAAMTLLLVRLAFVNHTSSDRSPRRVAAQGAMLAAAVTIGTFVMSNS